jgi:hypothetical protein
VLAGPDVTDTRWAYSARRQQPFVPAALAVIAGAVLLIWPALLNGYPIVFSDTHAFLVQAGEPRMVWDKPFAYGPFLRLLHSRATLWIPCLAQGLLVSHLLWLGREAFRPPTPLYHLALCTALALLTPLPWFTALLMPDVFAGMVALCLFLIGFGDRLDRSGRVWAGLLATLGITIHLSHLVIAACSIVLVGLLRFERLRYAILPLAAALGLLSASNLVAYGRFAVSPFGSVFLLARLSADGAVAPVLQRECPRAGWRLCAWAGNLPADSDVFLWDGKGPVWTYPGGPEAMAREASAIVKETLFSEPGLVARAALANTLDQLAMIRLGDTLASTWLEASITGSLRAYFPPVELDRFRAGLQAQDQLAAYAAPFNAILPYTCLAGFVLLSVLLARNLTIPRSIVTGLAATVFVSLLANAAATGALSKPHDRYQTRIVWLLLAAPLLVAGGLRRE